MMSFTGAGQSAAVSGWKVLGQGLSHSAMLQPSLIMFTGALVMSCCMLQDEVFLNGTIVLPHKELKETVLDQGTIIM